MERRRKGPDVPHVSWGLYVEIVQPRGTGGRRGLEILLKTTGQGRTSNNNMAFFFFFFSFSCLFRPGQALQLLGAFRRSRGCNEAGNAGEARLCRSYITTELPGWAGDMFSDGQVDDGQQCDSSLKRIARIELATYGKTVWSVLGHEMQWLPGEQGRE
ncbi:hypothetical protein B0T19DRAFT_235637 [Cercophora scortea]|uniref:Uncharacterized protein n=1 Tax=Cercophora scortea TaxID=314031 RepID=A0AAE0M9R9_9PEZI|nr:hypothetical protein B0T19DRAFT_235637 [Cercophora scortea]